MSEWIENNGTQPVRNDTIVDMVTYNGDYSYGWKAGDFDWEIEEKNGVIEKGCIRKWRTEVFVDKEEKEEEKVSEGFVTKDSVKGQSLIVVCNVILMKVKVVFICFCL